MDTIERFNKKTDRSGDCWLWTACKTKGYGVFRLNAKNILAHRFSYETFVGPIPDGHDIDHKCCNRSCVNPEHLRPCTRSENIRGKRSFKNKCGFKGVYKNKKRFSSIISMPGGKRICLGTYDTPEEAHKVYCEAARQYFGDFANNGNKYI